MSHTYSQSTNPCQPERADVIHEGEPLAHLEQSVGINRLYSEYWQDLHTGTLRSLAFNARVIAKLYSAIENLGTSLHPESFSKEVDKAFETAVLMFELQHPGLRDRAHAMLPITEFERRIDEGEKIEADEVPQYDRIEEILVNSLQSGLAALKENYRRIYQVGLGCEQSGFEEVSLDGVGVRQLTNLPSLGLNLGPGSRAYVHLSPFAATLFVDDRSYVHLSSKVGSSAGSVGLNMGHINLIRESVVKTPGLIASTIAHETMHAMLEPYIENGLAKEPLGTFLCSVTAVEMRSAAVSRQPDWINGTGRSKAQDIVGDFENELLAFGAELCAHPGHQNLISVAEVQAAFNGLVANYRNAQKPADRFDHGAVKRLESETDRSMSSTDRVGLKGTLDELAFVVAVAGRGKNRQLASATERVADHVIRIYSRALTALSDAIQEANEISPECGRAVLAAAATLRPWQYHHLGKLIPLLSKEEESAC